MSHPSWDDKLDSATLTSLVDEQQKLAQGSETPIHLARLRDLTGTAVPHTSGTAKEQICRRGIIRTQETAIN